MCYDISYLTKRQVDYAVRYGTEEDVEEVKKRLPAVYHTNGFQHREIPVSLMEDGPRLKLFEWGLIPFWVKNQNQASDIRNKTLNARGETIFSKPSFRFAAKNRRCLVIVDGFFEHHHHKGKSYPYFIQRIDQKPFALGGLWEEWNDRENGLVRFSASIITTMANARMAQIHNNPTVLKRGGPRMPFIVPFEQEHRWLNQALDPGEVEDLIQPFSEDLLQDYTVHSLRGKEAKGNSREAIEPFVYAELQQELP